MALYVLTRLETIIYPFLILNFQINQLIKGDSNYENIPSKCGYPGRPMNGFIKPDLDEYSKGEKVNYTCNDNYVLFGPKENICLDKTVWKETSTPTCKKNLTGQLEYLHWGKGRSSLSPCRNIFSSDSENNFKRRITLNYEYNDHKTNIEMIAFTKDRSVQIRNKSSNEFSAINISCDYDNCKAAFSDDKIWKRCCLIRYESFELFISNNGCELRLFQDTDKCDVPRTNPNCVENVTTCAGNPCISYTSKLGYQLKGNRTLTCVNRTWIGSPPYCSPDKDDSKTKTDEKAFRLSDILLIIGLLLIISVLMIKIITSKLYPWFSRRGNQQRRKKCCKKERLSKQLQRAIYRLTVSSNHTYENVELIYSDISNQSIPSDNCETGTDAEGYLIPKIPQESGELFDEEGYLKLI